MIKPKRTLILCLFMLLYAWAAVAQQKVVVTDPLLPAAFSDD